MGCLVSVMTILFVLCALTEPIETAKLALGVGVMLGLAYGVLALEAAVDRKRKGQTS